MAQGKQGRRQQRRKHHPKKKSPTNKSLNKKIKHIENNLMELKFIDQFVATTTSGAGTSDYLTGTAQGDTNSNRQGNVINPTSIQWKVDIFADPLLLGCSRVRMILFWDRQPNGAVPVLTGAATAQSLLDIGVVTDSTLAPRNFNTIDRYHILIDKVYVMNPQVVLLTAAGATTQVVPMQKTIHHVHKLSRLVKYDNTSAAITASVSNALHAAYFTDVGATQPSVQCSYRLYFRDS